jgi:Arc/MetJ-type ribon-helix-helix transcriptional regulator
MRYDFPSEIKTMIDDRLATGRYASENEVLQRALRALTEYDETVSDIQQAMYDEAAGRIRPLHDVDDEIRRKLGFTS